mgnify:CR=1 FL=1
MTTQEFIGLIDKQLEEIAKANYTYTIVSDIHAMQVKRVFTNGINGNEMQIGTYSTKPMLASKEQFTKESAFKQSYIDLASGAVVDTKGDGDVPYFLTFKNRKTGVRNKKATAIMFLGEGYKEFKKIQGKESNFVNLRNTEALKFDFTNSLVLDGTTYKTGTKRKENSDKAGWMADKYGKQTFAITKKEIEIYKQRIKKRLIDTLNNNPS